MTSTLKLVQYTKKRKHTKNKIKVKIQNDKHNTQDMNPRRWFQKPSKTPQQRGLGWGHPPPQWPHPSFPSHKLPTLGYTYVGGAPSKYIKFGNGKLGRPGQWTGMIIEMSL